MLISDQTEDGTPICELTKGSERLVKLRCDSCGVVSTSTWNNYQQFLRVHPERKNGETYCRPCSKVLGGQKQRGKKNAKLAELNRSRSGDKAANWQGGKYIDQSGYVLVLRDNHKDCKGWLKYQKEHIVVVEASIGRALRKSEAVHHIDNDRQNNRLENLYLTNHAGHRLAHVSLVLAYKLLRAAGKVKARRRPTLQYCWEAYRKKLIVFDKTQGIYVAHLKSRELLEPPHDL